jgi:Uma2 family endonuclease
LALPHSKPRYAPDEYLALERESQNKHEYSDGYIYAMAGESPEHSTICFNLYGLVHAQLRGKACRGFSPNMKVRTSPNGLYSYPDLSVVCGEPVFHDRARDVLVNPTVIVEVLSPSTEAKDRGEKFFRYQQIASLADYLLVSQREPRVERYARQSDQEWLYSVAVGLSAALHLASIDCRVALSDVYDRVEFPPETEEGEPAA